MLFDEGDDDQGEMNEEQIDDKGDQDEQILFGQSKPLSNLRNTAN